MPTWLRNERPGAGDPARTRGPGPEMRSGYFQANNRSKRSVTLDLDPVIVRDGTGHVVDLLVRTR